MTKKNDAIWYDWNSPSGFELVEIENHQMNARERFSQKASTFKIEQLRVSTCGCNSKSRVVVTT